MTAHILLRLRYLLLGEARRRLPDQQGRPCCCDGGRWRRGSLDYYPMFYSHTIPDSLVFYGSPYAFSLSVEMTRALESLSHYLLTSILYTEMVIVNGDVRVLVQVIHYAFCQIDAQRSEVSWDCPFRGSTNLNIRHSPSVPRA
jgi:hypothetical protein